MATVRLWDRRTGKPRAPLTGHTDAVYSVAFSPDGSGIASGGADSTVRLWDAYTGQPLGTPAEHTPASDQRGVQPRRNGHRIGKWEWGGMAVVPSHGGIPRNAFSASGI